MLIVIIFQSILSNRVPLQQIAKTITNQMSKTNIYYDINLFFVSIASGCWDLGQLFRHCRMQSPMFWASKQLSLQSRTHCRWASVSASAAHRITAIITTTTNITFTFIFLSIFSSVMSLFIEIFIHFIQFCNAFEDWI